ncbi:MAG: Fibronectin type III domain-containing protein [Candidatus Electronema aureum]|uniref:Fibronectin type III domain-containing protein n=1 Tax=Candidatus Electronema aureum TaxID=2005002 RepID=A0A521G485_9BACT|nr:MAG: Fibronectin type III domain-containing protein [Candidatus Electronema aureum]
MNFPHREAEIRALAQNIIAGLTENADFPNPPIAVSELRNLLDAFINQSDAQVAAQAAAQQATEGKRDAQDRLVSAMKTNLHYAEDAAQGNDAKLAVLGWGARANPGPPAVPGQPRLLETVQQSAGWLHLDWKRPASGGIVSYYTVKRRERAEGDWTAVGTFIETEATLNNQKRGKELEFCVVAVNRTGEGVPSNSVSVVL